MPLQKNALPFPTPTLLSFHLGLAALSGIGRAEGKAKPDAV